MSRGLDENNIFGSHVRCPDCNVIVATNQECSYCVRRAELSEKKQAEGQLLSEIQSQNDREEAALVKISKSGASGIVPKYIEDRLLYVELLLLAIWTTIDFVFFCSIGEPQAGLAICIAIFSIAFLAILYSEPISNYSPTLGQNGPALSPFGIHCLTWGMLIAIHIKLIPHMFQ